MKKALIIGGGLGGLGLALRLNRGGWDVRVLEQNERPGGKMSRWEAAGHRFDTGPSIITMPWAFREFYAELGERMEDHIEMILLESPFVFTFPNGEKVEMSGQLPRWLETVRRLEGDTDSWFRFMILGARLFEITRHTYFRRSIYSPPDWETLRALPFTPLRHAWGNYKKTARRFFKSDAMRRILDRFATYVGSSPNAIPATLAVIPYMEQAFGAWYVRGGLYRIVESLVELCGRRGVGIQTGARVVRIVVEGGRARGVELASGERLDADIVVMNGDASATDRLLGRGGDFSLPEQRRSLSGFVMLLGLDRQLPGLSHHSAYFSDDYDEEFRQLFVERRFPDDPTVYVNAPGRTDRSVCPPGGENLFIMANAPANDPDRDPWDEAQCDEAERRVFERLRRSGFPDIQDHVVARSVWSPRRIADRYDMPGGALYGAYSHGWRNAFFRPPNKNKTTAGLYHVGGSVQPGGGAPTVLMSARITEDLIKRHEQ